MKIDDASLFVHAAYGNVAKIPGEKLFLKLEGGKIIVVNAADKTLSRFEKMLMRNHWGGYNLRRIIRECVKQVEPLQPDVSCALSILVDKSKKFNQNNRDIIKLRLFRKTIPQRLINQLETSLRSANPKLYEIKDLVSHLEVSITQENSGAVLTSLVDECQKAFELLAETNLKITIPERVMLTTKIQNYQNLAIEKIEAYYIQDKVEVLTSRAIGIQSKQIDDEKKDLATLIKQRDELSITVGKFTELAQESVVKSVTESLEILNDIITTYQTAVKTGKPVVSSIARKEGILIQKGDGNCLFRSFATALYLHAGINLDDNPKAAAQKIKGHGDQLEDKYHGFLRQQAADFIEEKYRAKDEAWLYELREACAEHMEKIVDPIKMKEYREASEDQRLELYMRDVRKDKVFATNIQLQALAQIYGVNIHKYQFNEKEGMQKAVVADLETYGAKTLRLHYTGNHYNVFTGDEF